MRNRCLGSNAGAENSCCTPDTPCGEGEGDCDDDNECLGNLKCGQDKAQHDNNCAAHFDSVWDSKADCCYDPNIPGQYLRFHYWQAALTFL